MNADTMGTIESTVGNGSCLFGRNSRSITNIRVRFAGCARVVANGIRSAMAITCSQDLIRSLYLLCSGCLECAVLQAIKDQHCAHLLECCRDHLRVDRLTNLERRFNPFESGQPCRRTSRVRGNHAAYRATLLLGRPGEYEQSAFHARTVRMNVVLHWSRVTS